MAMMNVKNRYFKPFVYCTVITFGLGMVVLGILALVGPISWAFVPTDPAFPTLGNIVGLLALVGFFGTLVFGLLWIVAAFRGMNGNSGAE